MITRPIDNDFAEWAFGADIWTDFLMWEKDCIDLLYAWNDRHHKLYYFEEDGPIQETLKKMQQLYNKHGRFPMDKKMHKVTESMRTAGKDIAKGKPAAAAKVLKGAEKKNEKLVKEDRDVRDPIVKAFEKSMPMKKKGCK